MEKVKGHERIAMKRKGGRPKKDCKRDEIMMVRLTKTERSLIENMARGAGLKPSEWFRQAAQNARVIARLSTEEMSWLRDLSGLCNNLNQLTRLAHSQGLTVLSGELKVLLDKTSLLIQKLTIHDR